LDEFGDGLTGKFTAAKLLEGMNPHLRRHHLTSMGFLHQFGRLCAATQLLPALESGEETLVGGQAVLEGVMMR